MAIIPIGPDRGGQIGTPSPWQGGVINQQGVGGGRGFYAGTQFGVPQYYGGLTEQAGLNIVNAVTRTKIEAGLNEQARVNELAVKAEAREFGDWYRAEISGLERLKGRDAIGVGERFLGDFEAEAARRLEWIRDPAMRQAVQGIQARYREHGANWAGNYQSQQINAWEEEEFLENLSGLQAFVQSAPDSWADISERGADEISRHYSGLENRARISEFNENIVETAVMAKLGQGQVGQASDILRQAGETVNSGGGPALSAEKLKYLNEYINKAEAEARVKGLTANVIDAFLNIDRVTALQIYQDGLNEIRKINDQALRQSAFAVYEQNYKFEENARDAQDSLSAEQFWAQVDAAQLSPADQLTAVEELRQKGRLSREAAGTLAAGIRAGTARTATAVNESASQQLMIMANDRRRNGSPMSDTEYRACGQRLGLTVGQISEGVEYNRNGGLFGDPDFAANVLEAYRGLTGNPKANLPAGMLKTVFQRMPSGQSGYDAEREATIKVMRTMRPGEAEVKGWNPDETAVLAEVYAREFPGPKFLIP